MVAHVQVKVKAVKCIAVDCIPKHCAEVHCAEVQCSAVESSSLVCRSVVCSSLVCRSEVCISFIPNNIVSSLPKSTKSQTTNLALRTLLYYFAPLRGSTITAFPAPAINWANPGLMTSIQKPIGPLHLTILPTAS